MVLTIKFKSKKGNPKKSIFYFCITILTLDYKIYIKTN